MASNVQGTPPAARLTTQDLPAASCKVENVPLPASPKALLDSLERPASPRVAPAVARVEVCATPLAAPVPAGPSGVNLRAPRRAEPPRADVPPAAPAAPAAALAAPPAAAAPAPAASATTPGATIPGAPAPGAVTPGATPPGATPPAATATPNAGVDGQPGATPAGTVVTVTTRPEHIEAAMARTLLENFRNHPNAAALLDEVRAETGKPNLTMEEAAAAMVAFMRERNKSAPTNADGSVTWNINVADAQILANAISAAGGADAPVMLAHMMMSNYLGAETERIGRQSNLTPQQISELVTQQLVATRNDHGTPTQSRQMVSRMAQEGRQTRYFYEEPTYAVEERPLVRTADSEPVAPPAPAENPHRISLADDSTPAGVSRAQHRRLAREQERVREARLEHAAAQRDRVAANREQAVAEEHDRRAPSAPPVGTGRRLV